MDDMKHIFSGTAAFQNPILARSLGQLATSVGGFFATCAAMYLRLGRWQQRLYRLSRHPIVSHLILPPAVFLLLYRIPFDAAKGWRHERRAIYVTNVMLVGLFGGLGLVIGFGPVLAVQLPTMLLASIIGVWLFSVQHRFECTHWASEPDWSFATAALYG